jgi:hypothetical protein
VISGQLASSPGLCLSLCNLLTTACRCNNNGIASGRHGFLLLLCFHPPLYPTPRVIHPLLRLTVCPKYPRLYLSSLLNQSARKARGFLPFSPFFCSPRRPPSALSRPLTLWALSCTFCLHRPHRAPKLTSTRTSTPTPRFQIFCVISLRNGPATSVSRHRSGSSTKCSCASPDCSSSTLNFHFTLPFHLACTETNFRCDLAVKSVVECPLIFRTESCSSLARQSTTSHASTWLIDRDTRTRRQPLQARYQPRPQPRAAICTSVYTLPRVYHALAYGVSDIIIVLPPLKPKHPTTALATSCTQYSFVYHQCHVNIDCVLHRRLTALSFDD